MNESPDTLFSEELWTEKGFKTLRSLPQVTASFNQQAAEAEHLALAFLADERSMISRVLLAAGASPAAIKSEFEAYARSQPQIFSSSSSSPPAGSFQAGATLVSLVSAANAQRKLLTDDFLSGEHVLLALLDEPRCGRKILSEAKLDTKLLRASIDQVRGNRRVSSRTAEDTYEILDKFSRDLTAAAREGKLDPVRRMKGGGMEAGREAGREGERHRGRDTREGERERTGGEAGPGKGRWDGSAEAWVKGEGQGSQQVVEGRE